MCTKLIWHYYLLIRVQVPIYDKRSIDYSLFNLSVVLCRSKENRFEIKRFEWCCSLSWNLLYNLDAWSDMVIMLRSLCKVWLLTHHGALVIVLKDIDWNDCAIIVMFAFFWCSPKVEEATGKMTSLLRY